MKFSQCIVRDLTGFKNLSGLEQKQAGSQTLIFIDESAVILGVDWEAFYTHGTATIYGEGIKRQKSA